MEKKICNIMFDMGGVLIRFDRKLFIERLGYSGEDEKLLEKQIFHTLEWVRMDRGSLTDEEAVEIFCERLPERLHETARRLVLEWDRPIIPIEGMEELIRELKEKGYRIFLLSNASYRQHEYWPRIPGSQYFEDTLISCDLHLVKPQPEIFHAAYEKFGIDPQETLFIDDLPTNIEGAWQTGMRGFIFDNDVQELREWLAGQGLI